MYLNHFQLTEYPFQLTPDSDFLYLSESHARAKAYMDYTIWNRDGFVAITGDVGTGKTTLIQKLLYELDESVIVAKVFQTQLDDVDFLRVVLNEFGIKAFTANKAELIDRLNTFLVETFRDLRQPVLIVDEAQNLSARVLEEIRMLSGLETEKEKILHVILVGQPDLREKLESPELYQLLQRIRLRFHLEPLSKGDIRNYIMHRLRTAGAKDASIFAEETIPLIYKYTGGIPRLINTLCDTAMTFAYADDLHTISLDVINAVIRELQWLPYRKRSDAAEVSGPSGAQKEEEPVTPYPERRRDLAVLSEDISRIDMLIPTLVTIANRMITIENQLKRIADQLEFAAEDQQSSDVQYIKK